MDADWWSGGVSVGMGGLVDWLVGRPQGFAPTGVVGGESPVG